MSWFCESKEAKAQMEICEKNKCEGCYKCVWIENSVGAMVEYGSTIEKDHSRKRTEKEAREYSNSIYDHHPLMKFIIKEFDGEVI